MLMKDSKSVIQLQANHSADHGSSIGTITTDPAKIPHSIIFYFTFEMPELV
jgi:hypothetical protein